MLAAFAYAATPAEEIDNLLGKGEIITISNSYFALIQNQYPEEATRIGLDVPNNKLDERTADADATRLHYLNKIKKDLANLSSENLSAQNKIDYEVLLRTVNNDIRDIQKTRYKRSALYYADALDSIYDVMLKRAPYRAVQIQDIEGRLKRLPEMFQFGKAQLSAVPPADVQLAQEKIYNAFTNTKDVEDFAQKTIGADELKYISATLRENRAAMREFFDYIGRLNKEGAKKEYALGNNEYTVTLQNKYFIDIPTNKIVKKMEENFKNSRAALLQSMLPIARKFEAKLKAQDAALQAAKVAAAKADPKNKKAQKEAEAASKPSAHVIKPIDFQILRKEYESAPAYSDLLKVIAANIKSANTYTKGILPEAEAKVNINHMPGYIKKTNPAHLFVPPYGLESKLTGNLFIALPDYKDKAALDAQLKKYFTYPQIKLLAAKEVVPGKQMFYTYSLETSAVRRALSDDYLLDGWSIYAGNLAREAKFLNTPEDVMFLAWDNYISAAKAYADIKFHRRDLSYDEVKMMLLSFDIPKDDVDSIMKEIILNPGKALAAYIAYNEIVRLREKYHNQFGNKFNLPNFHLKLFATGKAPVGMLEMEMDARYNNEALTYESELGLE